MFLEAMASSKAVIAARAAAVPEIVPHGMLVEPDNDEALEAAIMRMYRDPALRSSLGIIGREFVRRFDAPLVSRMFMQKIETFTQRTANSG